MSAGVDGAGPREGEPGAEIRPPLAIGIVGGIASGKSFVTRLLVEHGAEAVDADRLAQAALCEPPVVRAVAALLGPDVLDDVGRPDRKAIAARVFSEPRELRALEAILHPRVAEAIHARLAALHRPATTPRAVAVLDVPLLLEAGLRSLCDELLFVEANEETRAERARARGWAPGEVARREARQLPLEQKRALASRAIPNDGDEAATARAVAAFWTERVAPRRD